MQVGHFSPVLANGLVFEQCVRSQEKRQGALGTMSIALLFKGLKSMEN